MERPPAETVERFSFTSKAATVCSILDSLIRFFCHAPPPLPQPLFLMPLCDLTTAAGALKNPGMRVSAFIEPCLPSPADRPPSGPDWIHEIKLDGFRMMVRRDPAGGAANHVQWT
jgi:hypothetical protein